MPLLATIRRPILVLTIVLGVLAPSAALAAEAPVITLQAGDILQLMPVGLPTAKVGWALTQDGVFKGASRESIFVSRFVQTGKYALKLETIDLPVTISQNFSIIVEARRDPANTETSGPRFTPTPDAGGRLVFPADGLLIVRALSANERPALDLDAQVDSDDDGDTKNDRDTTATLLTTDGVPLRLWFASTTVTQRFILVEPSPAAPLTLLSKEAAVDAGIEPPVLDIIALDDGTGLVTFDLGFRGSPPPPYPLLLQWDFGDASSSLLGRPIHRYLETGEYAVTVRLVNLNTGVMVAERTERVTIAEVPAIPTMTSSSSSTAAVSSASSSVPTTVTASGTPWLQLIIIGLIIFIVCAIIGSLIVMALGRMSGNGLQTQLTKIDEKLRAVPIKDEKAPKDSAPPTLVVTTEPRRPTPAAATAPGEPQIDQANAPSWLKKGLAEAATTPAPAPAPTPTKVATAPTPMLSEVPPVPKPTPAPVVAAPVRAPILPTPVAAPVAPKPAPTPVPVALAPKAPAPTFAPPLLPASVVTPTPTLPPPLPASVVTLTPVPVTPQAVITPPPAVVTVSPTPAPAASPAVTVIVNNAAPAPVQNSQPTAAPKPVAPTPPVASTPVVPPVSVPAPKPVPPPAPAPVVPVVTATPTPTPGLAATLAPPKSVIPPAPVTAPTPRVAPTTGSTAAPITPPTTATPATKQAIAPVPTTSVATPAPLAPSLTPTPAPVTVPAVLPGPMVPPEAATPAAATPLVAPPAPLSVTKTVPVPIVPAKTAPSLPLQRPPTPVSVSKPTLAVPPVRLDPMPTPLVQSRPPVPTPKPVLAPTPAPTPSVIVAPVRSTVTTAPVPHSPLIRQEGELQSDVEVAIIRADNLTPPGNSPQTGKA